MKLHEAENRIERAVNTAIQYGQVDGDHHKMWVIDQMLRELLGKKEYEKRIHEACLDEDGNRSYDWDTGIAP